MTTVDQLQPVTVTPQKRNVRKILKTIGVTGLSLFLLAMFLSPFLFMVFTALKSPQQMSAMDSPIWPAKQGTFNYQGKDLD
ncbi:hypothetical protein FDZ74_03220, partial [bacterium]